MRQLGLRSDADALLAESCTLRVTYFTLSDSGASDLLLVVDIGETLFKIPKQIFAFGAM